MLLIASKYLSLYSNQSNREFKSQNTGICKSVMKQYLHQLCKEMASQTHEMATAG
jgi:hypothetical protein